MPALDLQPQIQKVNEVKDLGSGFQRSLEMVAIVAFLKMQRRNNRVYGDERGWQD
jgi:hypothetical protein